MKAVITQGISCSGKSTYAAELVKQGFREINRDFIRFNLVKPGSNWRTYKFSKQNEKEVTGIEGQMIMESWGKGEDIVISNTNLDPNRLEGLLKHLEALGYETEVVKLQISREEAVRRDNLRPNGVGADVIYKQNLKMNNILCREVYIPNKELPKAIIVDVDGTIAEMHDRGPFEWDKVGNDNPRQFIIDMVKGLSSEHFVIVCSGRSDECAIETMEWLDKHLGQWEYDQVFMRKAGDFRKDNEVKEEIFWEKIAPFYNVVAAIDDRPVMIRLWHELKIPNVIAVADPYIEF